MHHRVRLLAAAGMLAAACSAPALFDTGYAGTELTPAHAKPAFTLTATDGRPFDFAADTKGRVTLLFFGYTHCPDVCPVHLANIAAALGTLSPVDRKRIRVVFVTTDPERDTPAALRTWLDNFDPAFVGLRGDVDEIHRIEASLALAPSVRDGVVSRSDSTDYGVGHAAQVLAFTADDSLRVLYPFGVRQQQWAADLPKLLAVAPSRESR